MDLFICRTPLQAYIIKNIILNENGVGDIRLLYLAPSANEINFEYFNQLKEFARISDFMVVNENLTNLGKFVESFYLLYMIRSKFKGEKFENVYISSITSILIQTLISNVSYKCLKSFDDGSGNYNYGGSYYNNEKSGLVLRTMGCFFGNRLNKYLLKKNIFQHFALDASKRNIVDNVSPLSLKFARKKQSVNIHRGACSVLIGTVYESISPCPERLIHAINNMHFINYYIPHPRYDKSPIIAFNILSAPSICEEKILNLFEEFDFITVYGFNTTALMTLRNVSGLKRIMLKTKYIKNSEYMDYLSKDVDDILDIDGTFNV